MKKLILLSFVLLLVINSCTDLQDLDENPNSVSEIPPHSLLTGIESRAFQVVGTDPIFASRMIISTSGENSLSITSGTEAVTTIITSYGMWQR